MAWLVLVLGTIVTGAGPHAGDPESGRNGFDETAISQLHADAVCILFGATVALLVVARTTHTIQTVRQLATFVWLTELAQGAIGIYSVLHRPPMGSGEGAPGRGRGAHCVDHRPFRSIAATWMSDHELNRRCLPPRGGGFAAAS